LLAGARREQVVRFIARHHRTIEVVGGALLVGVGIWDFAVNLDSIRLTFGV
jgi:cytochrome c biogenesis protein CcdA